MKFNLRPTLTLDIRNIDFQFARSSGAGGQNVNKVNSKAILRWVPHECETVSREILSRFQMLFGKKLNSEGALIIQSDRHRDQKQNVNDCIDKLREMLLQASTRPKRRIATKPTYSSKLNRLDSKKMNSEKKRNRKIPHD